MRNMLKLLFLLLWGIPLMFILMPRDFRVWQVVAVSIAFLIVLSWIKRQLKKRPNSVWKLKSFRYSFIYVPLFLNGMVLVFYASHFMKVYYIESSIRLENYQEEPIYWPGISRAVGVKMSFDIRHPKIFTQTFYPPKLFFSKYNDIPNWDLSWYRPGAYYADLRFVSPKIHNDRDEGTDRIGNSFNHHEVTSVVYYLYPDILDLVESDRFCVENSINVNKQHIVGSNASSASAYWYGETYEYNAFDLGEILTEKINQESILLTDTHIWKNRFDVFSESNLAGLSAYEECSNIVKQRTCYCYKEQ